MLDAGVPLVAVVFPVAAVSALDAREALDQLDHHAVLRHLVAELALDRWERSQLALGRDLVARGRDAGNPVANGAQPGSGAVGDLS